MRKGITPVIAIVLLLVMAVAVAGIAYIFITEVQESTQDAVSTDIKTRTEIMSNCVSFDHAFGNKAIIRNCGNGVIDEDSLVVLLDGGSPLNFTMSPFSISAEEAATITFYNLWKYAYGEHKIEFKSGMASDSEDVLFEPAEGLVAGWGFDEGSGTNVDDESPNGNDGTIIDNEGDQWVVGKFGNGLDFDGVDDYVRLPDDATLDILSTSFTISMWVKYVSVGQMAFLFMQQNAGSSYIHLYPVGGPIIFTTWTSGGASINLNSGILFNDNQWHLITAVRDEDNAAAYLYVDGSKVAEQPGAGDDISLLPISGTYGIGKSGWGVMDGLIDEPYIWERAYLPDETVSLKIA